MKRTQLRSKEIAENVAPYHLEISKKDNVELLDDDVLKLVLLNKEIAFFYHQDKIIPTLQLLQKNPCLKQITVDMGAIKFVIGGAHIMRPGITHIDADINKDDPVMIIDQTHKKPLAVGIALLDGHTMEQQTTGKVIENIHYIGDKIWTFKIVK